MALTSTDPESEPMTDQQDLAPWAHPKAQAWFQALFQKTQFPFVVEDVVKHPEETLSPDLIRVILALAILMGRKEIWPAEHRLVLNMVLEKSRAVANRAAADTSKRSMTLQQHRNQGKTKSEIFDEIEILRRRLGKSFKTNTLPTPTTWKPFWT
jgi:hypothetical protein